MPALAFRALTAPVPNRGTGHPGNGPVVQDFDEPKVWRDGKQDGWSVRLYLDDGTTQQIQGTSTRGHGYDDAERTANELWGHTYKEKQ